MQLEMLDPAANLAQVEAVWEKLTAGNPPSYFVSWGWMKTWLEGLPADSGLKLGVFHDGDVNEPLLAAFLGHATIKRRKIFKSNAYLLNETGRPRFDQVYSEYNGFLVRPGVTVKLADVVKLLPGRWEELCLSGVDTETFPGSALEEQVPGCKMNIVNRTPAPYVDLEAVAERKGDPLSQYLGGLSSNTRSQIRRSYKLYRQRGDLVTEIAPDAEAALAFYEEMKVLHRAAWKAKGEPGAFTNRWFDEFHQRLIRNRFAAGEIQMVKTTCAGETIGVIYNFVHDGRIYYYQAGFRFEEDNKLKPGYVCHSEAILHNLGLGHRRYEFLGGYEDFKLRLSTNHSVLVWARLQKPRLKFTVENLARDVAIWAIEKREERKGRKSGRKIAAEVLSQGTA